MVKMQFYISESLHSAFLQQYLSTAQEQALPAGLESHFTYGKHNCQPFEINRATDELCGRWIRYKMPQFDVVTHTLAERPRRHLFSFAKKLLSTKTCSVSIIAQKVSVRSSKTSGFFVTWLESP